MANWSKRKVDSSEINKGQEYTKDDNVSVEELNAIVNNSFNAQGEAEKSLNTVKGFQIGTAISGDTAGATINVDSVGEKIILNLVLPKGEKGDKGDKGESGSFGTMDYSELSNKPQINGKELNGNLTTEDLGIETIPNVENFITKDVNNLTNYTLSTGVGTAIDLAVDTTNYKITVSLKNSSGTVLSSDVVDLPLESVVVSGSYDSTSKKVILTLQNGSSIDFSVADLVSGLASQSSLNTTNDNVSKLSTRVGTAETNISNLQSNKVDKVSGKGLSTNDYTTAEKTKLSGIAEGAEVNVQSDWNATSGDAFIKNKPTLFSGNYNDLTNKPTIPTNNNQLTNGAGYITSSGSITGNAKTATTATNATKLNNQEASYYLNYNNLSNKPTIPSLNGVVKTTGDQTIEGIKNFKDGVKLGNNQHGVTTGQIEIDGGILENPNLNSMTYRGIFHCIGGTNVPNFDHANTSYDLMVFNGGEYDASGQGSKAITQMVIVGFKWWIRRNNGSDWASWERFGQATVVNSLTNAEIDTIFNS